MFEFHFLRPWWLLTLLLLPLLWQLLRRLDSRKLDWNRLLPAHLHRAMLITPDSRPLSPARWPWLAAALALFCLAGPSWQKVEAPVFQLNQGRVLVMDMSYSMYATDLPPNRLTQARFKAIDLIRQFDEGETALVAFAGDAFALSPLTEDKETLLNLVPNLSPEIMPVPGSDLPSALELANQLLKDAGYQRGEIILFVDGLNEEHADQALKLAKRYPWTLKVYALGSEAGAPMRASSGELIKSRSGEVVVAQTNLGLLGRLAQAGSGPLVTYSSDDRDIGLLAGSDARGSLSDDEQSHQSTSQWQDMGVYLLPLLLLPAAVCLRRHWAVVLLPLVLLSPTDTRAAWWQSAMAEAEQLMEQQQYDQAAELLPAGPTRAQALYRAGDYQRALEEYQGLEESAVNRYNQGNALARLNRFDEAKAAYRQALKQDPGLEEARENLKLLEELDKQRQPQDSDQKPQDDSQQQQDGSQQRQDDSQQQQDDSQQQQDGSQQQQDGSQQQQDDSQQQQDGSQQQQDGSQQQQDGSQQQQDGSQQQQNSNQQQQDADQQQNGGAPAAPVTQPEQPEGEGAAPSDQAQKPGSTSDGESQAQSADGGQQLDPRMLDRVKDDPSTLLRNKMKLEYERRRRAGTINEERTQW